MDSGPHVIKRTLDHRFLNKMTFVLELNDIL
jgi:hypothetical protein